MKNDEREHGPNMRECTLDKPPEKLYYIAKKADVPSLAAMSE